MTKNRISYRKIINTIILPRKYTILLGLVLIFINRGSGLVLPGATKFLIDDVILNKDFMKLRTIVLTVSAAIAVQAISSFLLTRIMSVEAQRFISELRIKVQQKIMSLPVNFFEHNTTGTLVSRVMNDVDGVRNLVGTGLVQLIGGAITSIISLFLLFSISTELSLQVLIPILIFGVISYFAFKKIRPIFRKRKKIEAEVTGRLTETFSGIRIVKGFNAVSHENEIFEKGVTDIFNNVKLTLTVTSLLYSFAIILLGFVSVSILRIGGYQIITDEITIGDFLSFTLYLGFLIAPIIQMSSISSQLTEAFAGLDRTEELMNLKSEDDDSSRTIRLEKIEGHINFENVSFAYDDNKPVLHNISFNAPAGSIIALVGSSGSGKSTIAGLTASFMKPATGKILVDGVDLSLIELDSYRSKLGLVLQDEFLFEGTIRENILFAKPNATEEELIKAVQMAYVNEFSDKFELGLETVIGERGIKLSGGQRQRVSIARAIIANPRILILDEATSSLDNESEIMVQKSLSSLMSNRTTLVIAHRLSTIKKATQILVIENGEIEEKGTHEELIEKNGRYFELYTYQSKI